MTPILKFSLLGLGAAGVGGGSYVCWSNRDAIKEYFLGSSGQGNGGQGEVQQPAAPVVQHAPSETVNTPEIRPGTGTVQGPAASGVQQSQSRAANPGSPVIGPQASEHGEIRSPVDSESSGSTLIPRAPSSGGVSPTGAVEPTNPTSSGQPQPQDSASGGGGERAPTARGTVQGSGTSDALPSSSIGTGSETPSLESQGAAGSLESGESGGVSRVDAGGSANPSIPQSQNAASGGGENTPTEETGQAGTDRGPGASGSLPSPSGTGAESATEGGSGTVQGSGTSDALPSSSRGTGSGTPAGEDGGASEPSGTTPTLISQAPRDSSSGGASGIGAGGSADPSPSDLPTLPQQEDAARRAVGESAPTGEAGQAGTDRGTGDSDTQLPTLETADTRSPDGESQVPTAPRETVEGVGERTTREPQANVAGAPQQASGEHSGSSGTSGSPGSTPTPQVPPGTGASRVDGEDAANPSASGQPQPQDSARREGVESTPTVEVGQTGNAQGTETSDTLPSSNGATDTPVREPRVDSAGTSQQVSGEHNESSVDSGRPGSTPTALSPSGGEVEVPSLPLPALPQQEDGAGGAGGQGQGGDGLANGGLSHEQQQNQENSDSDVQRPREESSSSDLSSGDGDQRPRVDSKEVPQQSNEQRDSGPSGPSGNPEPNQSPQVPTEVGAGALPAQPQDQVQDPQSPQVNTAETTESTQLRSSGDQSDDSQRSGGGTDSVTTNTDTPGGGQVSDSVPGSSVVGETPSTAPTAIPAGSEESQTTDPISTSEGGTQTTDAPNASLSGGASSSVGTPSLPNNSSAGTVLTGSGTGTPESNGGAGGTPGADGRSQAADPNASSSGETPAPTPAREESTLQETAAPSGVAIPETGVPGTQGTDGAGNVANSPSSGSSDGATEVGRSESGEQGATGIRGNASNPAGSDGRSTVIEEGRTGPENAAGGGGASTPEESSSLPANDSSDGTVLPGSGGLDARSASSGTGDVLGGSGSQNAAGGENGANPTVSNGEASLPGSEASGAGGAAIPSVEGPDAHSASGITGNVQEGNGLQNASGSNGATQPTTPVQQPSTTEGEQTGNSGLRGENGSGGVSQTRQTPQPSSTGGSNQEVNRGSETATGQESLATESENTNEQPSGEVLQGTQDVNGTNPTNRATGTTTIDRQCPFVDGNYEEGTEKKAIKDFLTSTAGGVNQEVRILYGSEENVFKCANEDGTTGDGELKGLGEYLRRETSSLSALGTEGTRVWKFKKNNDNSWTIIDDGSSTPTRSES